MKIFKILTIMILFLFITACGSNINTFEPSTGNKEKKESEFKEKNESNKPEEKPVEKPIEEKQEQKTVTNENPKPNEKPVEEKKEVKEPEVKEIVVEEKITDVDTKPDHNQKFFKDPIYDVKNSNSEHSDILDVEYYGNNDINEENLRNYNINRSVIDENGQSMVFIPKIYGGKFRIHHIDYDPEKHGFNLGEQLMEVELKQDDIVLIKMYIPETIPQIIITYEKDGEFFVQTIPRMNGVSGAVRLDKGFKIIDKQH
ncbi:hypothetical protein [Microaceticoccus formicicus]|uniref:hypothetical protein n=1 Tax=Microaceticoccus formicicus TaxID=3118105 RepID=UPI003CD02AA6|nr:hypothetical protein VZL98_02840 [Peptoniphilaceae bacterium AMB_02]